MLTMLNETIQATPLPPEPEFLTVKQAAKYLNVSQGCIYRLCSTNTLGHYKFGEGRGAIRINRTDLLEFVQRCRIEKREVNGKVDGRPGKSSKRQEYIYQHLDLRPKHACGGMTKAGTPCTRMTRDERCRQHQS
jgi:excisionase family DNA binding protein